MKLSKKLSRIFLIRLIFLSFLHLMPLPSFGWGMQGHRIVGEIADYYLSKRSKAAIKIFMESESLAMCSNWADFIKSDSSYNYMYNWHFVNLPEDADESAIHQYLQEEKAANVYNKINAMIAQLKNKKSTNEQKQFALRTLVHLIGDVHQPMHTGRTEDLGGNQTDVYWFGAKTNLHRLWDEQLIDYQKLSYTEYANAINTPSKKQLTTWRLAQVEQWVYESHQLCNRIYDQTNAGSKLSFRYNYDFVANLNEQLLKAGVRLAEVLNRIYG